FQKAQFVRIVLKRAVLASTLRPCTTRFSATQTGEGPFMRAHPVGRIQLLLGIWALFALLGTSLVWVHAQSSAGAVAIDADDIGGVVTGPNGPEAGVWVIAETTSLPTKFARIVVTDDQGRYVLPDLPVADYQVWVRGYGLVDSEKRPGKRGQRLNLTARV